MTRPETPYPPPTYKGDTGELTATHLPGDRKPDVTYENGTKIHYLATAKSTDGLFGLYRWEMGPNAGTAQPHFHRGFSESFYVLTGLIAIFDGSSWIDSGPGDFVHVPPGGLHGFRNESGQPASMLIHFSPGAPRESYFEGLPSLDQLNDAERSEFFSDHDNHWV